MLKSIRTALFGGTLALALVGAEIGTTSNPIRAATLLELPSTTISSGWFSPQTFNFSFSVTEAFRDITLLLTDGNQRADIPILGNVPLFGGLFSSATLSGTGIADQTIVGNGGTQLLAFGDYVNTFAGVIGPGDYSLQLNFLKVPIPTDYQGTLSAAVVPEPAEWMMMLGGLAMVGYAARRRAKSAGAAAPRLLPG